MDKIDRVNFLIAIGSLIPIIWSLAKNRELIDVFLINCIYECSTFFFMRSIEEHKIHALCNSLFDTDEFVNFCPISRSSLSWIERVILHNRVRSQFWWRKIVNRCRMKNGRSMMRIQVVLALVFISVASVSQAQKLPGSDPKPGEKLIQSIPKSGELFNLHNTWLTKSMKFYWISLKLIE